jgi:hypothetical protein
MVFSRCPFAIDSSWVLKILLFAFVLGLNLFFVLFSIVYCLSRDANFQYTFLKMSLLQIIIEVFVFCTCQSIILDSLMPDIIYGDMKKISATLKQLCSKISVTDQSVISQPLFDISEYLFVSKYVAKANPLIFGTESIIFCILHCSLLCPVIAL